MKSKKSKKARFDYDVFISYSSRNKEWVRGELLRRIEQAGLRAFIDYRDFARGAPSIKECERGVLKCRKTLLVLTPDYVKSGWAEFENILVQTLDPANESLRLIPLLKAECKKPLRIGALTHVDFRDGADVELAWRQLLTALGTTPEPKAPDQPTRDQWLLAHPYAMPPNFTGRVDEREMLSGWLASDARHPLLVMRALGGFGKSALAWHWLMHNVNPADWPRVVWWSFYETEATFDRFLARTLNYFNGGRINAGEPSAEDALNTLLQMLRVSGTLLVLDGFERELRAFSGLNAAYQGDEASTRETNERDCISPLADAFLRALATLPNIRGKVLITTRLRPAIVETRGGILLVGCQDEELNQMRPVDAMQFFHAQGIRGGRAEIEAACEPYGYHPLSLRLLAGLIATDLQQPGDIAAAKRMDVSGDLVQRKHHVLEQAYNRLTPKRKTLLGQLACFRGPMNYDALKALAASESNAKPQRGKGADSNKEEMSLRAMVSSFDDDLRDLISRGLLHHDLKENRFDLHPIVRRYAYDRLAAPHRAEAHLQLRDYFAAVPEPEKMQTLDDLARVIELYHHTVRAGQYDEAFTLLRERFDRVYFQFGSYQLCIDLLSALFRDGEDGSSLLKGEGAQAWTLNSLAISHSISGQPHRAVPLFEQHNVISEKLGSKSNLAVGLRNMAETQLRIGALRAAEANLRRGIALGREMKEDYGEATGHQEIGRLLAVRGAHGESKIVLTTALKSFEKQWEVQAQSIVWAYRALDELLQVRSSSHSKFQAVSSALESARRALKLADQTARMSFPYERDFVRAHWLLGAAQRASGQADEAEHHLHEALERCLRINNVEHEADILIDLARLRMAGGAVDEAKRLSEKALIITERCGYVLQGADAHLELAKLALAKGDKATARQHAAEARRLATCDGEPDYTYKAAYDEASELLRQLS